MKVELRALEPRLAEFLCIIKHIAYGGGASLSSAGFFVWKFPSSPFSDDLNSSSFAFKGPISLTRNLQERRKTSTQKTLICNMLRDVLQIYFASSRRNDLSGAHDFYNLWAFDEFNEPSNDNHSMYGARAEGTTFS
ncbi:hypothetical protein IFM89_035369 [Coptis chinensis]|uniref:Uncharacterized protein n=1 Tax=Coptis chinensis TaxID=261450 RepID=A0A835ITR3_9MAGN|nr:hypothetical protein IFM89_035369 [Coptis chinensis]